MSYSFHMYTSKTADLENFDYCVSPGTINDSIAGVYNSEKCDNICYSLSDSAFYPPGYLDELSVSENYILLDIDRDKMMNEEPLIQIDNQNTSDESKKDLSVEDSDVNNRYGFVEECYQNDDAFPTFSSAGDRKNLNRSIQTLSTRSKSLVFKYSDAELKKIAELRKCPHKLNEPSYSPLILRMVIPPHKENFRRTKSSSTSTLFMNSTIKAPNDDEIARCMSLVIYWNILNLESEEHNVEVKHIFSERYYPLDNSMNYEFIPSQDTIYRFLNSIFTSEDLSAECGVMVIAYIDRMQTLAGIPLTRSTWRRICLGCIMLASKVWEDQAVWNADFLKHFPSLEVNDLNCLEREVLKALEFNVSLKASVYAKYYFELRSLSEKDARHFPIKPLDKRGAKRLEESGLSAEKVVNRTRRRSLSMDYVDGVSFTPALIS